MKRFLTICSLACSAAFAACDDDAKVADTTADTAPDTTADSAPDTSEDTAPDTTADTAPDTTEDTAPDTTADTTPDDTAQPACVPGTPPCSDEQIATLQLSDSASGGPVTDESNEGGVFVSLIDATAGGFNGTLGYTYAKFTENGLVAVDLSDEDALDSTEWDIAARRFVLRLNSGVSGPSCVTGGRTGPTTEFDEVTALPEGIAMHIEQYFSEETCEYVPDTSGIGSPQTVLSSYWSYSGCVAMTGNVYVLELADGRHLKLQVMSYYTPEVQTTCDETGSAPTPNGAGNVRIKWAFIE